MFQILADIVANAGVPYNRLAVGFQSHVSGSNGGFFSKAALKANLAKLEALGADGLITELDIKISGSSSQNLRFQAAIWGDYLDVSVARLCAIPR
jgi:endo-1,4-beta-xylanase